MLSSADLKVQVNSVYMQEMLWVVFIESVLSTESTKGFKQLKAEGLSTVHLLLVKAVELIKLFPFLHFKWHFKFF